MAFLIRKEQKTNHFHLRRGLVSTVRQIQPDENLHIRSFIVVVITAIVNEVVKQRHQGGGGQAHTGRGFILDAFGVLRTNVQLVGLLDFVLVLRVSNHLQWEKSEERQSHKNKGEILHTG